MLFTGSPTKLNSTKHRNDTASMTASDCSSGDDESQHRYGSSLRRPKGRRHGTVLLRRFVTSSVLRPSSAHFIFAYLKLGESLAKIGIVTLSLIAQTISWWCSGR